MPRDRRADDLLRDVRGAEEQASNFLNVKLGDSIDPLRPLQQCGLTTTLRHRGLRRAAIQSPFPPPRARWSTLWSLTDRPVPAASRHVVQHQGASSIRYLGARRADDATSLNQVVVRCRPLNSRELARGAKGLIRMEGGTHTFLDPPDDPSKNAKATEKKTMSFAFDHSYWSAGPKDDPEYAGQQTVFEDLGKPLLDSSFQGYNTCVFACESCLGSQSS